MSKNVQNVIQFALKSIIFFLKNYKNTKFTQHLRVKETIFEQTEFDFWFKSSSPLSKILVAHSSLDAFFSRTFFGILFKKALLLNSDCAPERSLINLNLKRLAGFCIQPCFVLFKEKRKTCIVKKVERGV